MQNIQTYHIVYIYTSCLFYSHKACTDKTTMKSDATKTNYMYANTILLFYNSLQKMKLHIRNRVSLFANCTVSESIIFQILTTFSLYKIKLCLLWSTTQCQEQQPGLLQFHVRVWLNFSMCLIYGFNCLIFEIQFTYYLFLLLRCNTYTY